MIAFTIHIKTEVRNKFANTTNDSVSVLLADGTTSLLGFEDRFAVAYFQTVDEASRCAEALRTAYGKASIIVSVVSVQLPDDEDTELRPND